MKRASILTVVAALMFRAVAWGAPPEPGLLSNPDFSADQNGDDWPDDWPRGQNLTWQAENAGHFLRLRAAADRQMVLVYRRVDLPSPPPAALEVRLRVRYADIQHGKENWNDGRFMGHFKNATDRILRPEPGLPNFLGSSAGWVDLTRVIKVPKGATYLEFMPCLFEAASGSLDLAVCQVFPATAYLLPDPPILPSTTLTPAKGAVLPPELHVASNQLQTADGKVVWLQGLCVDSLQWCVSGENIDKSIPAAIDEWKANVIRLPVTEKYWFGRAPEQHDGGAAYRQVVDAAVYATASRGAYLVLDLHAFGAPLAAHAEFWRDAAVRYRNHPAVLFELFNEPHTISWKEWRDGGGLTEPGMIAAADDEEPTSPGMQGLLDSVRATGARNLTIAGGLEWSYDLSGVMQGYALRERAGGDGVMYSSHIYPWHTGWRDKVLVAAAQYPLFVGEVGCPKDWSGFQFIPASARIADLDQWPPDVLAMIQQHRLNWTGFSFHPTCGPNAILDWKYTPSPYWGTFVKDALSGRTFEGRKVR